MRWTSMLEQYWALKREAGDALLLYRLGDFYEMFFDDAAYAAPLLGLVLTARHKDSDVEAPMCGIPQHALEPYLARLRSEEHTSELQSHHDIVCRLLLE